MTECVDGLDDFDSGIHVAEIADECPFGVTVASGRGGDDASIDREAYEMLVSVEKIDAICLFCPEGRDDLFDGELVGLVVVGNLDEETGRDNFVFAEYDMVDVGIFFRCSHIKSSFERAICLYYITFC